MCAGGMSSSLMAKKVTEFLNDCGKDVLVTATSIAYGREELKKEADYNLYLVSPQVRLYFETVKELGEIVGKTVVQVKGPEYIPVLKGIQALAELIIVNLT